MSSSEKESVDLTIFDLKSLQKPQDNKCNDVTTCVNIKRILTCLQYYSLLQIHSNPDNQNIFNNFINSIYTVTNIIEDRYHMQKIHGHQIYEIMNHALNQYQFPLCDIKLCPYSSRLYRVNDKSEEINVFNQQDKESVLPVFIDIIDQLHNFIFHISECGLRDIPYKQNDENNEDNKEKDEYYDAEFSGMSARISSKTKNIQRFNRINASNKFSIDILSNDNNNVSSDGSEADLTYLDSIYLKLIDIGIDDKMIEQLSNYILIQQFDSESMDWDFSDVISGNIEKHIDNQKCTQCIKEIFAKANSMFHIMYTNIILYH